MKKRALNTDFSDFIAHFGEKPFLLFVQNVSSVRNYQKEKKRAALTFLTLSAVSEHLKAGRTWSCYVRQLNIRRKENGEYHDLIQEMRFTDPERHFIYFWMSKDLFDKLLQAVGPFLARPETYKYPIGSPK